MCVLTDSDLWTLVALFFCFGVAAGIGLSSIR